MIKLPEDQYSKYDLTDVLSETERRKKWKRAIIWNVVGIIILLTLIYIKECNISSTVQARLCLF